MPSAALILRRGVEQRVEAEANISGDTIIVHLQEASVAEAAVPESIAHYVVRTQESVILDDAAARNSVFCRSIHSSAACPFQFSARP